MCGSGPDGRLAPRSAARSTGFDGLEPPICGAGWRAAGLASRSATFGGESMAASQQMPADTVALKVSAAFARESTAEEPAAEPRVRCRQGTQGWPVLAGAGRCRPVLARQRWSIARARRLTARARSAAVTRLAAVMQPALRSAGALELALHAGEGLADHLVGHAFDHPGTHAGQRARQVHVRGPVHDGAAVGAV